jgi:hypothetical protein
MDAGRIDRIETSVERAATALFAGAAGYAAYVALTPLVSSPELAVCAAAAAIVAHLACSRALNGVATRKSGFSVRAFNVREIESFDDELLLTDAQRLNDELILTEAERLDDELVLTESDRVVQLEQNLLLLDDVLAEIGPDARVVRLFDRKAMPTPGQLHSRIDHHLGQRPSAQPDASQALSDALAELRRSLR